jgi:S1-C subfamily serine protease
MSANILRLTCPKCDTALSLKTAPAGGRCKCPKCGTTFATGAATLPEAKPAPKKAASPALQKTPLPKAALTPAVKDEPDTVLRAEPDKKGGGGVMLLLLGGGGVLVAGFLALMLLGGIIGLLVWKLNKSSTDKTEQPTAKANDSPTPEKEKAKDPPKDPQPNPGDGSLSADVLQRTKQATVYIKVQLRDGTVTGSGFFEQSSGLIVTNAHVVGMLKSKEPPKQIEVVLNSGNQNEATLPAKLLDVDRNSDLALLEVALPPLQANVQSKLSVLPAKDLLETHQVYVFGFPFGERVNKSVTVSPSAVTSLHKGDDGVLNKVQVNGGMQPGNSGGPVVDKNGNVIGVAVSIIEGTQINFAIPGEQVQALLNGRMTEYVVNTYAIPRNGKFQVHVTLRTIDPRKQISRIALDYWTGPAGQPAPMPSDRQPNLGNINSPRQTVDMVYDANKREAQADLLLDAVPDGTNRLWIQAVLTSGTGLPAWQKGFAFTIDPPVDPKPSVLKPQYRLEKVPVHLTSTANYKRMITGTEESSLYMNIDTVLNEETRTLLPMGGAQVRMSVQKFAIGLSLDNEKVDTSPEFQQAVKKDIGAMVLDYQLDGPGNLTSKKTDFTNQMMVRDSKEILTALGQQIHQSFEVVATPQLGNPVQPGQTWQAKRELPLPIMLEVKPIMMDVTYTYRGVRQLNGRQVAVVDLNGTAQDGSQSGKAKGTVLIDPETGMVLQAKAIVESTLTVVRRQSRGRPPLTYTATGTLEVKMQRGPGIN